MKTAIVILARYASMRLPGKPLMDILGKSMNRFGVLDKATAGREIMQAAGVSSKQTVYIGDDSIDLSAFDVCHFSFAVADAPDYVKKAARQTLTRRGGQGAFREVVDRILAARGQSHLYASSEGFLEVISKKEKV